MQHLFAVNRNKAEAPVMATFFIVGIFFSIAFYPSFRWGAFLLFPMLAGIFLIIRKLRMGFFKRQCFIFMDDEGIRYCLHLYQKPVFIAWSKIEKITFQMYEINIRIRETGEVVSLQIGYLKHPEEYEELKGVLDAKMM